MLNSEIEDYRGSSKSINLLKVLENIDFYINFAPYARHTGYRPSKWSVIFKWDPLQNFEFNDNDSNTQVYSIQQVINHQMELIVRGVIV